jgi:uncharacterized membrane protein SirB2
MTAYPLIKHAHLLFVGVSLLLFSYRALMSLAGKDWRRFRWLRLVPHINDTLLLLCGLTLAYWLRLSPMAHPWLGIKLLLLLGYILAGKWALSPNPFGFYRRLSFALLAWFQFAAMVWLAVNKPWGG